VLTLGDILIFAKRALCPPHAKICIPQTPQRISCGALHSIILANTAVVTFGNNSFTQLGITSKYTSKYNVYTAAGGNNTTYTDGWGGQPRASASRARNTSSSWHKARQLANPWGLIPIIIILKFSQCLFSYHKIIITVVLHILSILSS
jgi:hypothetical protein